MRRLVLTSSVVALSGLLVFSGGNALPGDPLHPVRDLSQDAGLADYTLDDVDAWNKKRGLT